MSNILIVDDDKLICDSLSRIFSDLGHTVTYCQSLGEGLKTAEMGDFDIVFLDVRLPDGNGLEYLPMIQAASSSPEIIILTGYADPDGAELAIKNNAWDYIKKPASIDALSLTLNRALQYRDEKSSARSPVSLKKEGIIGSSDEITACLDLVARAAISNSSILIYGETGTGKELFARAIHANSKRAKKNFVVVDCGSLPDTLAESILFGHMKGAFTGADRAEDGLIKHADGGTLFLDEIGELDLNIQKSFLRVLQERRFRPIGGKNEIKSDFRLVSATNRDLGKMVSQGQFRNDLLFRLSAISINLPPLRERKTDIRELCISYTKELCETYGISMKGFSPDFFEILELYEWEGNVRELFGVLEWTLTQAFDEPTLYPKHLPDQIRIAAMQNRFRNDDESDEVLHTEHHFTSAQILPKWKDFRKTIIEKGEKQYLRELMQRSGSNIKEASQISDISAPRLYELLRKYDISTR